MTAPGTKRLRLQYDEPLSNFAFNFNLRRYIEVAYLDTDLSIPSSLLLFVLNRVVDLGFMVRPRLFAHIHSAPVCIRPLPERTGI